jgi:hypothetical protein
MSRALVRLTTIDPTRAGPSPLNVKPCNSHATRPSIAALITSRNRPSVTSVIGSVRKTTTGRITAFATPRSSAAAISVPVPSSTTPTTIAWASHSPRALIAMRRRKPRTASR